MGADANPREADSPARGAPWRSRQVRPAASRWRRRRQPWPKNTPPL